MVFCYTCVCLETGWKVNDTQITDQTFLVPILDHTALLKLGNMDFSTDVFVWQLFCLSISPVLSTAQLKSYEAKEWTGCVQTVISSSPTCMTSKNSIHLLQLMLRQSLAGFTAIHIFKKNRKSKQMIETKWCRTEDWIWNQVILRKMENLWCEGMWSMVGRESCWYLKYRYIQLKHKHAVG